MKKFIIFTAYTVLFLAVATIAQAAQPTVTISAIRNDTQSNLRHEYLKKSYSWTNDAGTALDTAFIYLTGTVPFGVQDFGHQDSLFTFEFKSSETTAANVDHGLIIQATSKETGTLTDLDWHNVYTNDTFVANVVKGTVSVRLKRLTNANRIRILVYETQSTTDTASTCTLIVSIPKQ